MKLFLDIDGVLNDHKTQANGCRSIHQSLASNLNHILASVPECQIVISSAWRYHVHNGHMTLKGFEWMLMNLGVRCHGRLHGVTDADPETFREGDYEPPFDLEYWSQRGIAWRKEQILRYAEKHNFERFVVLDDLDLEMPEQIVVNGSVGLTAIEAGQAIRMLKEDTSA